MLLTIAEHESFDDVQIEDLPIRYVFSRQPQKFQPIPDQSFVFRDLHRSPLFPTDVNHMMLPVTIKIPGLKHFARCHVLMDGIRARYSDRSVDLCQRFTEEMIFISRALNFTSFQVSTYVFPDHVTFYHF